MDLIMAVCNGRTNKTKMLLESKADVTYTLKQNNFTALHYASHYPSEESVELLIQYKANVNARDIGLRTPLLLALDAHAIKCSKLLLKANANVNVKDVDNKSSLDYITQWHDYKSAVLIVQLLLETGAKTTQENRNHPTIMVSYRRLRNLKDAMVTTIGILQKRARVCKDIVNVIGRIIWETRFDQVWNVKKIK